MGRDGQQWPGCPGHGQCQLRRLLQGPLPVSRILEVSAGGSKRIKMNNMPMSSGSHRTSLGSLGIKVECVLLGLCETPMHLKDVI